MKPVKMQRSQAKVSSKRFKRSARKTTVVLAAAAAGLSAQFAHAQSTWVGDTSQDWNNAANWSSDPNPPTGNFLINTATAGVFPVLNANSAFTPIDIFIGQAGSTGRLDHTTAGTLATGNGNWMFVGQGAGGNGTYNLANTAGTGGTLTGFGVGGGSLNVGGASTTGGRLLVGDGGTSVGTVNMNTSGTLKTEEDGIGLILGNGGTSTGNFNLDGGTLQINTLAANIGMLVGTNGGDGNFRMSNGTVNQTGGLWVGDNNVGSQGLVEIGGTSTFNVTAGNSYIGRGTGQGTVSLNGGSLSFSGVTHVGYSNTATAGTAGTLNIASTFTNTGEVRVGSSEGNSAATVGAGTVNVNTGANATVGSMTLARGNDAGDTVAGTVNVNGGVLTSTGTVILGFAGNNNLGRVVVAGGTFNIGSSATSTLSLSVFDTSRAQVDVSSGNLNLRSNASIRFTTGNTGTNSTNVFNQTGGAVTFYSDAGATVGGTGVLDMQLSGAATVNNTYNLDGGTLTVPQVVSTLATGTRTFNFNGGTLRPTGSTAAFFNLGTGAGAGRANVRNAGAIVDTNTFNVTIGQALEHSNVGGDNATDGGLTKNGAGTLTLAGANTYTGPTSVNAGTLVYSTAQSNIGSVTVADGAGLGTKAGAAGNTVLTTTSLTLGTAGATNLTFDFSGLNPTAPQISTGALTLNGTITVGLAGTGGLTTNTYKLIDYTGALGGSFSALTPTSFTFGHSSATLVNNTGDESVDLNVLADGLVWSGAASSTWTTAATGDNSPPNNWATKNGLAATNFWVNDAVEFNDTYNVGAGNVNVTNRAVSIAGANVEPSSVTFNNSAGDYTISSTGGFGIAGTGGLTKNGTSKATLTTVNAYTGATTINAGTLELGDGTSGNDGTIAGTSGVTNNATLAYNRFGSSTANYVISGTGGVVKNGPGTQVLGGANTYAGGTTINAGILQITTTAGSANTGTFTLGGGNFQVNVGAPNFNYNPTINVTAANSSFSSTGAGQINYTGTLTGNNTALNVSSNTSRLYMNGTVSAVSQFNVTGGAMGFDLALGNKGGDAPVDVASGASLYLANTGAVANNVTLRGTGQGGVGALFMEGAGTATVSGTVTMAADTTIGGSGGNIIVSNPIAGSTFALTKAGAGTVTLNGANVYSGGTTINAGTLAINADAALGSGGVTLNAATLQLTTGVTATSARAFTLGGAASTSVFQVDANSTYTLNGAVTGTAGFRKAGAGTLVLGADNPGLSGTVVLGTAGANQANAGTLRLTSSGALGSATISMPGTNNSPVGLELANNVTVGNSITSASREGAGAVNIPLLRNVSGNNTYNGTITINATGGSVGLESQAGTLTMSGTLTSTVSTRNLWLSGAGDGVFSSDIPTGGATGNFALIKAGAGTWTLPGTKSYTGATTVNGGTLRVTGSIAASTGVTVNNGGTLDGTGAVSAITLNAGGKVSPGTSIETLDGTSMTWNSDGTTSGGLYELSTTDSTSDQLILSGALTQGTGSAFVFDFAGGTPNTPYTLITFTSTTFTDPAVFAISAASQANGYAGTFSIDGDSVDFTPSAVPEPASLGLLAVGAVGLLARRRGRGRAAVA